MKSYKYLIVGGGMTGDAAVQGIRKVDPDGTIGLFSLEADPPYNRPPLSKKLWTGKPLSSVWLKTPGPGLELFLETGIHSIDARKKQVTDHHRNVFAYEKLLLATGGTPNRLPFGEDHILYFRTLADYRRLQELTQHSERFAVIGGGFIGSEIAAALAMNGKQVTIAFPEEGIGARNYPHDLSQFLNDYYRQKGVRVMAGEMVSGLEKHPDGLALMTKAKEQVAVDGVVAGIGIHPNTDLAKALGIKVNNGIVVDEHLLTSQADIFAAGDVAEFYNPALGKYFRAEHEDNAYKMGRMAGRNMAGANEIYDYLPYFYSDLFDLGYEAVGELDSRLEVVSDWQEPYQKGVIYYLRDGRVRGVLLWNVWGKVKDAQELIAKPGPFQPDELKGTIR